MLQPTCTGEEAMSIFIIMYILRRDHSAEHIDTITEPNKEFEPYTISINITDCG